MCFVSLMPFGFFCVLVWAMVSARAWAVPASAAVGSWLVQTHIGYAPLVIPALLFPGAWLSVTTWRRHDDEVRSRVLRAGLVAVGATFVLWLPPLWDEVFGTGNLSTMVRWFNREADGVHSLSEGLRVTLAQFSSRPGWYTGGRPVNPFNGATLLLSAPLHPVLLVVVTAAIVVAARRRDRAVIRLAAVIGFMIAVSIVAIVRTIGTMYEYRLLWTWVVGALAGVIVVWVAWNLVAARWPSASTTVLVPITVVALLGLCIVQLVDVAQMAPPSWESPDTDIVARKLASRLDRGAGEVVLTSRTAAGEWYLQGVLLALERRGFAARVPADPGHLYGDHRVAGDAPGATHLVVLAENDLQDYARQSGLELVAYSGAVSLDQRIELGRESEAKHLQLLRDLSAGLITPADFGRAYHAANVTSPAVAVFREVGP